MAIGYGLTGKIRGKLGAQVYRIEAGKQIISEYNPEKQDPKTEGQLKQRARVVEANEISRRFPWECLVGLSPNRTKARQMFVGDIAKKTVVIWQAEKYVGTFDLSVLELSRGVSVLYDGFTVAPIATESSQALTAQFRVPAGSDVVRFLFVTIYNANGMHDLRRAVYALSSEKNSNNTCNASVVLDSVAPITSGSCYSWAVPIYPDTLKKRIEYSGIVGQVVNGVITSDVLVSFARKELFAGTIYLGRTDFYE